MNERLFIVNPAAGAGKALSVYRSLQRDLSRLGIDGEQFVTTKPGEALEYAARTGAQYRTVVAVGGDGTVFEVVSGLLSSGTAPASLGIIPCGTGNDTAQNLGISSPEEALSALAAKTTRPVDTIAITCANQGTEIQRHAVLFAAAGIVGPQLRYTTRLAKRILGRSLAYRFASLRAILSYPPRPMRVQCDEQTHEEPFLYIGVHNTESFGGGMRVAPGARPDDGLLNVNLIASVGRLEAIREFRRLCAGRHTDHPKVRYLTARSVSVTSSATPVEIAADGDLIGYTPATFIVKPRCLLVVGYRAGV